MAKKKRVTRAIVSGYLEKVNARIFDKFKNEITDMIKGHQGVYSLYRKNHLYYVGLATDLRNRIKHHLNDRHKGMWTHFSLYVIRKADYIKELESLLLRIAYPEGNAMRGKLKNSTNLLPEIKKQVKKRIKREYEELFRREKGDRKTKKGQIIGKHDRPLKGLFKKRTQLYGFYQSKEYRAIAFPTGTIKYDGQLYNSPSGAGCAVRKRSTNGWAFWKTKNDKGKLVKLKTIRSK